MEGSILSSIHNSSDSLRGEIATLSAALRRASKRDRPRVMNVWRVENSDQISQVSQNISMVAEREKKRNMASLMLHSLYFPQMKERYHNVAKAHAETFNWIFDGTLDSHPSWSNHIQWLRNSDSHTNLYWVTGKAGSGKSTLMKYLCDSPATKEHLEAWADPAQLVFASCFFWNPGTKIQKSLTGLLLSLLHGVLSQCHDLMQTASPWRWQAYDLGASSLSPWSTTELLDALRAIVFDPESKVRFAFYIDGLDEYEGDDAARSAIIDLFQDIASTDCSKLCISSRPWLIFEDAFERGPSLRLEELTQNDVTRYITDKLGGNLKFRRLSASHPTECTALIRTIVDKAAGVFLWVFLVVRLLSQGFQNEDDIVDLQRRLDLIPSDLEDFFARMIGTLDSFYLEQAARLFKIALTAETTVTLLTYAYTQERDPEYAIKAKVKHLPQEEGVERLMSMKRLLNSRCKGLLEAHEEEAGGIFVSPTVHFLHRTARDFLLKSAKNTKLDPYMTESYDVNTELCKAYLAQIKSMDLACNDVTTFFELFSELMKRASRLQSANAQACAKILDELDRVIKISTDYWSNGWRVAHRSTPSPSHLRSEIQWTNEDAFVSLALIAGLQDYIKGRVECDELVVADGTARPLLDSALRPDHCDSVELGKRLGYSFTHQKADPGLVKVILEKGGDLDEVYGTSTIWSLYLHSLDGKVVPSWISGPEQDNWFEVTRLCLVSLASTNKALRKNPAYSTFADDESVHGTEILERTFGQAKTRRLFVEYQEARKSAEQSKGVLVSDKSSRTSEGPRVRQRLAMKIAHISSKCTKSMQLKKT